jgi:O-6-methylguanine DNA methyltransferase
MDFKDRVYNIVGKVPKGKVATYGQVARLAGNSKAARAVGALMKNNPDTKRVPCHRVVSSKGKLTGYSAKGGIEKKKEMLAFEGVYFVGDTIDLSRSQITK